MVGQFVGICTERNQHLVQLCHHRERFLHLNWMRGLENANVVGYIWQNHSFVDMNALKFHSAICLHLEWRWWSDWQSSLPLENSANEFLCPRIASIILGHLLDFPSFVQCNTSIPGIYINGSMLHSTRGRWVIVWCASNRKFSQSPHPWELKLWFHLHVYSSLVLTNPYYNYCYYTNCILPDDDLGHVFIHERSRYRSNINGSIV